MVIKSAPIKKILQFVFQKLQIHHINLLQYFNQNLIKIIQTKVLELKIFTFIQIHVILHVPNAMGQIVIIV
ncbi:transmembrane protein, putative (macronuclear) [Tetrahymena thermophila SB210]|uniref:Transmembrane protein, putative n=1 Tax=Tetrahymena thermophila (strain SB210) TaxID=312017 RepID=W7XJN1_TETTS|nr:transmembrane protein, putative [Tetrahymena thermophila SB210]EWS75691.1 transmembrane protein, putative [Tetrahymena thermophila SB210]|eukprot:XP_012651764.1 transmembrane protein, putative [Tetrahymena thermophila SB210]